jgi:hypothetical protein
MAAAVAAAAAAATRTTRSTERSNRQEGTQFGTTRRRRKRRRRAPPVASSSSASSFSVPLADQAIADSGPREPREDIAKYIRDVCMLMIQIRDGFASMEEMSRMLATAVRVCYHEDSVAPCYRVVFTITSPFLAHIPSGDAKVVHAISLAEQHRDAAAVSADADVHQQVVLRQAVRASHCIAVRMGIREQSADEHSTVEDMDDYDVERAPPRRAFLTARKSVYCGGSDLCRREMPSVRA